MNKPETKRQQYEILRGQLELDRQSFVSHYKDLCDYISPRRGRFQLTDVNRGDRRNKNIIDSTATFASRTLRSGMMAGMTSPARPWFRLTTPDPKLAESTAVKEWLHTVSQRIATVFLKSNLYQVLPAIYGDLGDFATAAMYVEEDTEAVARFYPFPVGSYMIANNDRLKVDVFFREFRMTVRQLVTKFGATDRNGSIDFSNFSTHVHRLWEIGERETWIDVCHLVQPNPDYDPDRLESKFKKFMSCYYERGTDGQRESYWSATEDKYLSEKGYDFFPVLVPRWEATGEDSYGTSCPGMIALGDIKQLQLGEKRSAQAIEKMVHPPLVGPSNLQNVPVSQLPGGITYSDSNDGRAGLRPLHELNPRIAELEQKQAQIRERIKIAYYENLFLMLANSDRREFTAREIDERHEEKLLALGPVLEQVSQDLLDPLIEIIFSLMLRQSTDARGNFIEGTLIPPPPEELKGLELKVEYLSIMAQAQKYVGLGGVERFFSFVGQIAAVNPAALDKVEFDQGIDVYGDITSIPPGIIRSDDDAEAIRSQRAQAEQAQQQAMMIKEGSSAAKNLSQSDMSGDSALTRLMGGGGAA